MNLTNLVSDPPGVDNEPRLDTPDLVIELLQALLDPVALVADEGLDARQSTEKWYEACFQCDQTWRNFAIRLLFSRLGKNFGGYLLLGEIFGNLFLLCANFLISILVKFKKILA